MLSGLFLYIGLRNLPVHDDYIKILFVLQKLTELFLGDNIIIPHGGIGSVRA